MSSGPYPAHPRTPYPPLVINAALTGQVMRRERAPWLPLTAQEIARDAAQCVAAGASILHLHARDADGRPAWRADAYRAIIAGVRERCGGDVVLCVTTSGRDQGQLERRADVLTLRGSDRPDMASLTLGSLNFHTGPSINAIDTIERLASAMAEAQITHELELFDLGMAHQAHRLRERGLLPRQNYANLMLGFPSGAPADARSLLALIDALPPQTTWAAGGLGDYQQVAGALAVVIGGHVRTGLEDNPDLAPGVPARNAELVARAAAQAEAVGRPVATARQARELIGLPVGVA